jgi:hypothetical protein
MRRHFLVKEIWLLVHPECSALFPLGKMMRGIYKDEEGDKEDRNQNGGTCNSVRNHVFGFP